MLAVPMPLLASDFLLLSGLFKNARELASDSSWVLIHAYLDVLARTDDEDTLVRIVAEIRRHLQENSTGTLVEGIDLGVGGGRGGRRGGRSAVRGHTLLQSVTIPGVGRVGQIVKSGVSAAHVKATGRALQAEVVRMGAAPLAPVEQRRINAWVTERPDGLTSPLVPGETYRLNFNVGVPHAGALLPETAAIPLADIPEKGLETVWMVVGDRADLAAIEAGVETSQDITDGRIVTVARFELLIPRDADSDTVAMALTPREADAHLHVLIFVQSQLYRSFDIVLAPTGADAAIGSTEQLAFPTGTMLTGPAHGYLPLSHQRVLAFGAQMNLRPPFEWTTPPGELTVWLDSDSAKVFGILSTAVGSRPVTRSVPIPNSTAILAGLINNVRLSAEAFRDRHGTYLDAVDPGDLRKRLERWQPNYS